MSTRGDILRRAAQVEPDAVPEPWRPPDDENALATVSDREHYRKNLVTLPDGAGEVPAYVWDFSRTPTIPDEVREEWTRGSAGRVLGPNGKFVSRGSDVPRLSFDGEDPGLLVESAGRTNKVQYSASIPNNWAEINGSISTVTSAFQGGNAGEVTDGRIEENAGTTSGGQETISVIIEKGSSNLTDFAWKDTSSSAAQEFRYRYDWSNDTLTQTDASNATERFKNFRTLQATGPNGGQLVRVAVGLTAANTGTNLLIRFWGDPVGNGNTTILHHAQIEEAPNASSPIVTQGSPVTRAEDDYAIFKGGQPEWWNPNEGTIIAEVIPTAYRNNKKNVQVFGLDNGTFQSWAKLRYNTPTPIGWAPFDGSASARVELEANAFTTITGAVSATTSKIVCSANGQSNKSNHNGNLLNTDTLTIGEDQKEEGQFILQSAYYIPRALPESTLNAITS